MASNNHKYNPQLDYNKGFNEEPLTDGRRIPQDEKEAAQERLAALVQKTREELND